MRLPRAPSLEELRAHTPGISPVSDGVARPFWSVMIPTYNSGPFLRRTLESVLREDPGPEQMQIEVVDGCSTEDDPERLVEELGAGRIGFHRLSQNRGPAHTFNVSIERSRGHWLHILHGDDIVMSGFYRAYAAMIAAQPQAKMILGQAVKIDEADRWIGLYGAAVPPVGGGIMDDFVARQAVRQLVLFNGVVVRRDAYEQVGGFCTLFHHVADWDMWFRLGQHAPVAWVPLPYALYRIHAESDTNRQRSTASNIRESYFVVGANLARLNGQVSKAQAEPWRSELAVYAESTAWQLDNLEGRYNQARWAWMLQPTLPRLVHLLKLWLKIRLGRTR